MPTRSSEMHTMTVHDRVPLEIAIEAIEQLVQDGRTRFTLQTLTTKATFMQSAPSSDIKWWCEHVLGLLIKGGYIARKHCEFGKIEYAATDTWKMRNALLLTLRPPIPVVKAARVKRRIEQREMKRRQKTLMVVQV